MTILDETIDLGQTDHIADHEVLATKTNFMYAGTGSPEGVVTAPVGATFSRTDGGADTTYYVKESGAGNTGWVAVENPAAQIATHAAVSDAHHVKTPDQTFLHEDLTDVDVDQHHNQVHALAGSDHTATGITDGYVATADSDAVIWSNPTTGVTDHGLLDAGSLNDDDHTHYHTDARGDLRYLELDGTGQMAGALDMGNQSLHSPLDPTGATGVGDRDFNDGRYVQTNRFTVEWSHFGELVTSTEAAAFRWKAPFDCTVVSATVTAGTAPTGAAIIVDASNEGTTMFSTKPTLAATSQDGTEQAASGSNVLSATDVVRIWVTQIGSTLPGENVSVILEMTAP